MAKSFCIIRIRAPAHRGIYSLSLHDALPICWAQDDAHIGRNLGVVLGPPHDEAPRFFAGDRKSTRLNSSHANISYAASCLKKKTAVPHNLPMDAVLRLCLRLLNDTSISLAAV